MRLIDGDALKDRLQSLAYDDWNQGVSTSWSDAYIECADMVEDTPTIEPERKTGKWVKHLGGWYTPGGDMVWECSECGKGVHVYGVEYGTYGADVSDGQWKACPNCTALMEE